MHNLYLPGFQWDRRVLQSRHAKMPEIGGVIGSLAERIGASLGDIKFPDAKIGEIATEMKQWMSELKVAPGTPAQKGAVPAAG